MCGHLNSVTRHNRIRHKTQGWPIHSSQIMPSQGSLVTKLYFMRSPRHKTIFYQCPFVTKSPWLYLPSSQTFSMLICHDQFLFGLFRHKNPFGLSCSSQKPVSLGLIRHKTPIRADGSSQNPFNLGWFIKQSFGNARIGVHHRATGNW